MLYIYCAASKFFKDHVHMMFMFMFMFFSFLFFPRGLPSPGKKEGHKEIHKTHQVVSHK